ncbi:MAG: penicillin acylase family protein [Acidobacteria bacterium]|jgi:penicillin amidase|nr:penicillin acylase family protein [Acidobacteriota bacterium]
MARPDPAVPPPGPAPDAPAPRASRARRLGYAAVGLLVALALSGFTAVGIARQVLRASLPRLDGAIEIAGLTAPVRIERDAIGVPTVSAAGPLDASRALGFLHAQERFFQMDLARRRAAGELSALFGAVALEADREVRIHRFRARAAATLAAAEHGARAALAAYAEGVNAGLAALGGRPFEYLALRSDPLPWRPEDTILVVDSMALVLQDDRGQREARLARLYATLPAPLADFLVPAGTPWDAPLEGPAFSVPEIPGPAVLDLRAAGGPRPAPSAGAGAAAPGAAAPDRDAPGSNNWAIAGARTAHGGALLAGDMHLPLGVPATWYRATLRWPRGDGGPGEVRVAGVTLPGVPGVVAGSNGLVAWAFTNSYADTGDLVLIDEAPDGSGRYLAPGGPRPFERFTERIEIKGSAPATLEIRETIWGPIVGTGPDGRPHAYRWAAHEPDAVNLGLFEMAAVRDLDEALALAPRCGMPAQNAVFADAAGRIGWTILGRIPKRVGFDGRLPSSWADGTRRWDGWLPLAEWPRVVDPPTGALWTANARVAGGEALARIGDGGYDHGARAAQIRDRVLSLEGADEAAMLALQLDDRALLLAPWRDLLLEALSPEATGSDPRRTEARRLLEGWGGRASTGSAGYRIVRDFRVNFARLVFRPLLAPCEKADPSFSLFAFPQWDGPLWKLVRERPAHLLDPRFSSWNDAIISALDATLDELTGGGAALADQTWGRRNTVVLRHPLSGSIPLAGAWLNMPAVELPGDTGMPRVQARGFGASQRMVVSPGRESGGIFQLPAGQSGHPLSPHYGDQQERWARGTPAPFLPGPAVHLLDLVPAR